MLRIYAYVDNPLGGDPFSEAHGKKPRRNFVFIFYNAYLGEDGTVSAPTYTLFHRLRLLQRIDLRVRYTNAWSMDQITNRLQS
jgi:hypothetical protein